MASTANRLKEGVRRWYEFHSLSVDSPQLIALSGGADSMALLYILKELSLMKTGSVSHLAAAYYNHNLRSSEELEREITLIREICSRWNIPLVIGKAGAGELEGKAFREKRSLEDVARDARYAFLENTLENRGKDWLVLAHHGSDQAETMVTRFFQGSGLSGLCGIRPIQGSRLRPLLAYPKEELVRCLKDEGIPWSEDSTNGDNRILRNNLRDNLIPEVGNTFPGYETSLSFLSEKITRYDTYLKEQAGKIPWEKQEHGYSLETKTFLDIDPALREYALYAVIDQLLRGERLTGGKGRRMPYRFIRPLLDLTRPRRMRLEGHGLKVSMDKNSLAIVCLGG